MTQKRHILGDEEVIRILYCDGFLRIDLYISSAIDGSGITVVIRVLTA